MPGYNSNYGGASIYVDISDVAEKIDMMTKTLTEQKATELLRRTFNDASKKVKTIIRTDVPKDYAVKASWAGSSVGWPKVTAGGGQVNAVVPLRGTRGSIGGTFSATGGSFTRKAYTTKSGKAVKAARVSKKIRAKILKGTSSAMPDTMEHQGGQPPFMINGVAFTRKYAHKSHPIVHVVGLAVPQMPLNKSREKIENDIKNVVEKRLVHHYEQLFK